MVLGHHAKTIPMLRGCGGFERVQLRGIGSATRAMARTVSVGPEKTAISNGKKTSRQEKVNTANMISQGQLFHIDRKFGIFSKQVFKVLNLGSVPGNWSQYAKYRLCQAHGIAEEKFHSKCHILGVDVLFSSSVDGASVIQGNVFSKLTHESVIKHFQELVLKDLKLASTESTTVVHEPFSEDDSRETTLEKEFGSLSSNLEGLSTNDNTSDDGKDEFSADLADFGVDLVLSDLAAPMIQTYGSYSNTSTRPYLRFNSHNGLNRIKVDPFKASFDLADAALLLTTKILKPTGNLVLRLPQIKVSDPEVDLLQERLSKAFKTIHIWSTDDRHRHVDETDIFFICLDKRGDVDVNDIF